MPKTALIIGGGAAGCAAAHLMSQMDDWEITLVESAPFLGAGVRTFFYGGHPYTFGPRHFLTQKEEVFRYLHNLLPMRRCNEHQFWSYVTADENFYNFPIHEDDISDMPDREDVQNELWDRGSGTFPTPTNLEEYWLSSVGPTLYRKFIESYSQKMWGIPAKEIDTFSWSPKGVALKSGPRAAWDTAISAYPTCKDGYNSWFDKATANVKVLLNTKIKEYEFGNTIVWFGSDRVKFDVIVSTISPDIPFGYCHGRLPYVGRDFYKIVLPVEFALPKDVYWVYNTGTEPWTRLTEFKKLTGHKSTQTLLGMEVPSQNGRHYPIPTKQTQRLAERYFRHMGKNVYSIGRSGSYRYGLDISHCIEQAMELVEVLKQGGQDHPVIGAEWRA